MGGLFAQKATEAVAVGLTPVDDPTRLAHYGTPRQHRPVDGQHAVADLRLRSDSHPTVRHTDIKDTAYTGRVIDLSVADDETWSQLWRKRTGDRLRCRSCGQALHANERSHSGLRYSAHIVAVPDCPSHGESLMTLTEIGQLWSANVLTSFVGGASHLRPHERSECVDVKGGGALERGQISIRAQHDR